MAQKVGEEGVEVVIAAMKQDSEDELISETADLLFHLLVLLRERYFIRTNLSKVSFSKYF
ncbi:phosphoribosyl-ATP diphosphatase [Francisella salimarina]|uniref:phosphoribosyl-ATP diphosphatase n=1 Tax=Francisella salimarina TaxID=2599927 RepID=UPI003D816102